ncbi:MAG: pyruvate dehydrogenase (acetyl-transferring), homodimeric type, partial [Acidobacteriota bacterium]
MTESVLDFETNDWQDERSEWLEALSDVLRVHGPEGVREILRGLDEKAAALGVDLAAESLNTPYKNSIPVAEQPAYPGDVDLEERIENVIRWNAMAMVLQANDNGSGVGGHIATYASAATMLEVGFNHFFKARSEGYGGDLVNVQAHASPGVYARAFLEGRISIEEMQNFRRELQPAGGLPSYPHPRRMPGFWQMPTASMGLSTVSSIYQARFARYLENRGLKPVDGAKVWTFIGDGEADEPEVVGTIGIAAREGLDNLILSINCNLQRLDGPVRGNGKVIQELERSFRGAGWNVIKVIWGGEWDALFERDDDGVLLARMEEAVDGDYQMYSVLDGKAVRDHWVRDSAELAEVMKTLTDETVRTIKRGGHDHLKVYAAFEKALETNGRPTVILFKTIKGYGLG